MTIHIVIPDDYQFATQKLDFLHSNNNFHCTGRSQQRPDGR